VGRWGWGCGPLHEGQPCCAPAPQRWVGDGRCAGMNGMCGSVGVNLLCWHLDCNSVAFRVAGGPGNDFQTRGDSNRFKLSTIDSSKLSTRVFAPPVVTAYEVSRLYAQLYTAIALNHTAFPDQLKLSGSALGVHGLFSTTTQPNRNSIKLYKRPSRAEQHQQRRQQ